MPTVASTVSHAAAQRTSTTATAGTTASTAAGATGNGLDGAFAQMVTASDTAAAQSAGRTNAAAKASDKDTGDSETSTDKDTADATASSDIGGVLALLLQSSNVPLATSGGLPSPASLGGQSTTVSATSSSKPGIDAGSPTVTSNSTGTSTDAASAATSASVTVSAGDAALAAIATSAAASGTASKSDAASTTASATDTASTTAAADAAKTETAATALGLQSLVARHTTTEKSTGTPLVYGRPTGRGTDGVTKTATTSATATEATQDKLSTQPRIAEDPTAISTTDTKTETSAKGDGTPDRAGDPTTPILATHAGVVSPSAEAAAQATQVGAIAPTDHHKATDALSTDQTTATAPTHAVPLSAVADTIATHAKAGSSHFAIKLDPAELGSVDVRVEVKSTGEVRAHLIVERSDTLDMMMRDQKTLERSLGNAGLDVGSSGLQFSLRDQGNGHNQPDRDQTGSTRTGLDTEDTGTITPDIAAIAYRARRVGGLDLRI